MVTFPEGSTSGPPRTGPKHAVWHVDQVLKPFKGTADVRRLAGYAGPPDRKYAEVISKYTSSTCSKGDPSRTARAAKWATASNQGYAWTCPLLARAPQRRREFQIEARAQRDRVTRQRRLWP